MPIKWSAFKVSEVADKIEELVKQAAEPLEKAREVAREAKTLQYIEQDFSGILGEIERVTGGEHGWGNEHYDGSIIRSIDRLRSDIPKDTLQAEQTSQKYGSTQSFV